MEKIYELLTDEELDKAFKESLTQIGSLTVADPELWAEKVRRRLHTNH